MWLPRTIDLEDTCCTCIPNDDISKGSLDRTDGAGSSSSETGETLAPSLRKGETALVHMRMGRMLQEHRT